MSINFMVEY